MRMSLFGRMPETGRLCQLHRRDHKNEKKWQWAVSALLLLILGTSSAQLPDLESSGLTPSGAPSTPNLACSSPLAVDSTISQFADDLSAVLAQLPRLDGPYQALAQDAVQALREDYSAGRTMLCEELTRNQEAGLNFFSQARDNIGRGSLPASGCFDRSTYLTLLGIQTVISAYADGVQIICDSTQCATLVPPRIPECIIGCAGTAALFGIVESFQLALDLDDQCSFEFHDFEMDRMRSFARFRLAALSVSNSMLRMNAESVADEAAQQEEMENLAVDITEGFDGGGRGAGGSAVLPSLADLQSKVQQQGLGQLTFETQNLNHEIEAMLAASLPISLLQLPPEHDGLLLLVREVVANSIQSAQAIGVDVSSALDRFRAGDVAFNANQFRQALVEYQQAYLEIQPGTRTQGAAGGGQ